MNKKLFKHPSVGCSMKSFYQYLGMLWKKPQNNPLYKGNMIEWRRQPAIVRVERPTRLDKARALGYKAKRGFTVVKIRLKRGGHKRSRPNKGRKSKNLTVRRDLKLNYRQIAEQRVAKKYPSLEVLNSYWLAKDGQNYYYEVILVDPNMPDIKKDKDVGWISKPNNRKRPFRGLTSAGKKSRDLRAGARARRKRK